MKKSELNLKMPAIAANDAQGMVRKIYEAAKDFQGTFDELESAIGMYFLGRLVGWKVLILIHNKRTIRKYEEILGIKVREAFDETGPFTEKSAGYEWAQRYDGFWKAVSGEFAVKDRRRLQKG